jgi:hypothetical protein
MAARTLTVTGYTSNPKGLHVGENVVPFDFNSGTGKLGTISDVLMICKLPNGATFTGANIRFGAELSAATTWTAQLLAFDASGTSTDITTLASSGSMTANATTAQGYTLCSPYKVSLSDDRAIQFAAFVLNCTVGGSETVSFSLQGAVRFLTDGTSV